jgi:uncharacterized protein DUF6941
MEIELDGFLADSVAAVQGKLYALGAGWNRIGVAQFPARHDRVGIGLLFRVPAGMAAEPRRFELRLLGPDGTELTLGTGPEGPINRIGGEFTAGGSEEQIVPIALNLNGLALPATGAYRVVISVQGADVKTLAFTVVALAETRRGQSPEASREPPAATGTAGYL